MNHTYAREYRESDGAWRMHCSCGKTSRWNVLIMKTLDALDKHADFVAKQSK